MVDQKDNNRLMAAGEWAKILATIIALIVAAGAWMRGASNRASANADRVHAVETRVTALEKLDETDTSPAALTRINDQLREIRRDVDVTKVKVDLMFKHFGLVWEKPDDPSRDGSPR